METLKLHSDIFKCTDLTLLKSILSDPTTTDEQRLDAAYQYDRLKAHLEEKSKKEYNANENKPIINEKYADII